ncbi:hypothetical protein [Microbacterium sp. 77mftsu3.1]|uniref:hypothetical protein n=1 Tax=Microbacterium sp. 77mftsu3.1 TaxID=1761802 RepID=UPI000370D252|nr:hypothetical protein [Microbacterium sp. 77mftsu3.1]SDH41410.1 hypothetical protein SAMN04488590_3280 [Microbacterium sp. 77mftsu3.1]
MSLYVHITRVRPATHPSSEALRRHIVTLDDGREYITSPRYLAPDITEGARGLPAIDYKGHLRGFRRR